MSVQDQLALIFNQAVHFEGRKQVPLDVLVRGGLRPSEVALAVQFGWLKQGVLGYWLPEPCDPGFLSVVDHRCASSELTDHRAVPPTLADGRTASRGKLTGRFGKG